MTIKDRVRKLTKYFGTNDPFEIAEALGVLIVKHPLVDVRGYYHYFQRCDIIYIDDRLPEHVQKFVCAHELGHMFLHKGVNAVFMDTKTHFKTSKYETEADSFAMELLVPNEVILENIYFTVYQLSQLLGYDKELVRLRLKSFREM